jgi:hypothetical protein
LERFNDSSGAVTPGMPWRELPTLVRQINRDSARPVPIIDASRLRAYGVDVALRNSGRPTVLLPETCDLRVIGVLADRELAQPVVTTMRETDVRDYLRRSLGTAVPAETRPQTTPTATGGGPPRYEFPTQYRESVPRFERVPTWTPRGGEGGVATEFWSFADTGAGPVVTFGPLGYETGFALARKAARP